MAITAASGDYSYQPTCYQLIQGAARLVSAIQTGETLPDDEFSDMLFALNGMVTAWQASGIHVWAELDATLFLQPGQIQYQIGAGSPDRCCASNAWLQTALGVTAPAGATTVTVEATTGVSPLGGPSLGIVQGDHIGIWLDAGTVYWTTVAAPPVGLVVALAGTLPSQATAGAQVVDYQTDLVRPLKVPSGRRVVFTAPGQQIIKTPMSIYSRIDYGNVPNPTTPGLPTALFFDPQLAFAVMNIWPAPNNTANAVSFTAQRPLQDFVNQANAADLPIEWSAAIRFNLAKEIALEYDVPADRLQTINALASEKLEMVAGWDREMESIYFGVEGFPATRN